MKRRQAILHMAWISTGIALMPACTTETWPTFDKMPLEIDQLEFVKWLCAAILPKAEPEIVSTPEPTSHFVLRMINDTYDPEDIQRYMIGMKLMEQHIKDEYKHSYEELNPEQQVLLFTEITESPVFPKTLKFFLQETRQLCIRHFTTAEYFMTNHLRFKFIPGPFKCCIKT